MIKLVVVELQSHSDNNLIQISLFTLTSLYMGSLFREGLYCSHNTVKTVNLPLKKQKKCCILVSSICLLISTSIFSYPSTASSRNQIKFKRGWTKGGPFSMDGCFSVYVLNTTEALFLFFKQRNLGGAGGRRRTSRG